MKLFNPNATGSLAVTGSANITEDLTVGGVITAQEFHTEFISASIIYDSGSTQFGNSLDDIHNFSGSLAVNTNNLFVSGGNVGIGTSSPQVQLDVNGRVSITDSVTPQIQFFESGSAYTEAMRLIRKDDKLSLTYGWNSGEEALTVTNTGNVGIGTTSPDKLLHLSGENTAYIRLENNKSNQNINDIIGGIDFKSNDSSAGDPDVIASFEVVNRGIDSSYGNRPNFVWSLYNPNSQTFNEIMTIDYTGKVGIGTTSPSYTLHVNGSVAGVGAYVNLSDIDYKKNIYDLTDGLDKVLQLRPVTFNWKNEDYGDRINTGFIAQEVEDVLPNSVITTEDTVKSIATSELIAVLTKAVQELKAEVNELRSEINTLKGVS